MHRDIITHILYAQQTDFLITGSQEGVVKFWKKTYEGIDFVKQFRATLKTFTGMCVDAHGTLLCTTSSDNMIKIFDVVNFDQIHMISVDYTPGACQWIHSKTQRSRLAVASQDSGKIYVYHGTGSNVPLHTLTTHAAPVTSLCYCPVSRIVISADSTGLLDYWSAEEYTFPDKAVDFKYKFDTDLFVFVNKKCVPLSLDISPDGKRFSTMGSDRIVRIFKVRTGKMVRRFDERLRGYDKRQAQTEPAHEDHLDSIDFGLRMSVEKKMQRVDKHQHKRLTGASNVVFDATGHFVMYATMLGIKVVNIDTKKVVRVLGRPENTTRFMQLALFQGRPATIGVTSTSKLGAGLLMTSDNALERRAEDPTLFCNGFSRNRFYWFSTREPGSEDSQAGKRDVFNERVIKGLQKILDKKATGSALPNFAVIHTTMGDIQIELQAHKCPKTVENFTTHAKNGYYNNTIFHRIIKNFMIQGGDPDGDGTGGTSIWGRNFKDEFHPTLKHSRAGILSMANVGPNTNGSQFFITTVPTPWLDGKHTVFGQVTLGLDVVAKLDKVATGDADRPLEDIQIINIDVKVQKFN
jgi:peptidylprolyl isomerase domain and WD repeat-containing protein 1